MSAPPATVSAIDLALIRKYAAAAPRYTSYPPATQFTEAFGADEAAAAIAEDNGGDAGPLSLYVHIPFCASQCWYCGCTTVITRRADVGAEYVADLEREIGHAASRTRPARAAVQIHFGGGTPTYLEPGLLVRLGGILRNQFPVAMDAEFGVEIDPRRLTSGHVEALAQIGVNRASLGIQDTNPQVQLAIHRWQPMELNVRAFQWLRQAGIGSINVDLIYGLPRQTAETFAQTIRDALTLEPDRLSVFSYAHVPWRKPAQRAFERGGELPSADEKLAMFALAHELLGQAGYIDIGLDHFARPEDELARAQAEGTLHRNFQGYSTHADASLYGFGMSSISSTPGTYWQNHKELPAWRAAVRQGALPVERGYRLTAEDRRRRTLVMRLMCDRRLDYAELSRGLGVEVPQLYAGEIARLEPLERDGLLVRTATGIEVNPPGIPLLRVIASHFDATFRPEPGRHAAAI
ncbi:MAG TPA: oxygen-independent coproporphyrinogen III oxidase [Opitutaceae bacterium]|jgi:oxygen-independent coproporphyrinogen-3 oxidase|nr:oxygen-independent coproporphyrinogen III oxidase [Opitutaceae bacterium]